MGRLTLLGAGGSGTVAAAPVNTVAPVISGTNVVGNVLTVTTGTWTGSPAPTFAYWWKRNGSPVAPIPTPGATTYNLTQLDAGYNITCEVYATNPSGTASAVSNTIFVYDADAYAFDSAETAAGTPLTTTERNAINDLVINLKNAFIWTKFKALYPFIGSTATSQKFNLKNPANTNAAFRLTFAGGWTHTSTGANPTGPNAYANTYLTPSVDFAVDHNKHLSFYSRTNAATAGFSSSIGSDNSSNGFCRFTIRQSSNGRSAIFGGTNGTMVAAAETDSRGFYVATRPSSTTSTYYKNGTTIATGASTNGTTSQCTLPLFICAAYSGGTITYFDNKEVAFASIGDSLTDLETQVFNQIVEGYQFALGRNINPSQSFYYNRSYGNTVNAFLYSTQVTDATTQQAVAQLVSDLLGYGIWSKMKAIYPMVGTTATQQKFNLVNSQDTDAAFRLNFIGGWTHSSLGATGNGTNTLADTFLTPSVSLSLNNTHVSVYSRTNNAVSYICDIGAQDISSRTIGIFIRDAANGGNTRINEGFSANWGTVTNSACFYLGNRTASNVRKTFINGTLVNNNTTASTGLPTVKIGIGASYYNNSAAGSSYFSNRQYSFVSIGDGLTDTEAANFSTAVNTFQTTLGRNVY